MGRSVNQDTHGAWWAYVWDDRAATLDGRLCPDMAMASQRCDDQRAAERWCAENERAVVTRYRARCAYDAGLPFAHAEWLPYFRIWNADRVAQSAVAHGSDPVDAWTEAYEQGG